MRLILPAHSKFYVMYTLLCMCIKYKTNVNEPWIKTTTVTEYQIFFWYTFFTRIIDIVSCYGLGIVVHFFTRLNSVSVWHYTSSSFSDQMNG